MRSPGVPHAEVRHAFHPPLLPCLRPLAAGACRCRPAPAQAAAPPACPAILQHTFPRLQDEKPQSLCQYAGKVVLVVNTASFCGFTPQYKGLEALRPQVPRARPGGAGLSVQRLRAGKRQQQGDRRLLRKHLRRQVSDVRQVLGARRAMPTRCSSNWRRQSGTTPKWNFHKYLIGRDGKVVETYSSMTSPDDRGFVATLEKQLGQRSTETGLSRASDAARSQTFTTARGNRPELGLRSYRSRAARTPDSFSCCEAFRALAVRSKSRGDSSPPPSLPPSFRGASQHFYSLRGARTSCASDQMEKPAARQADPRCFADARCGAFGAQFGWVSAKLGRSISLSYSLARLG